MGKDLHYLVVKFFREKMIDHSKIINFVEISDENDILYKIERTEGLNSLVVHLSDAYRYTLQDYYSKPKSLGAGDFILIVRPEAGFDLDIIAIAAKEKIGIGKIGTLLGALNRKNIWQYKPKE